MVADDAKLSIVEIGVVHSRIRDRRMMPAHGAPATVEVYPEFAGGLRMIEENSHLWILAWFSDAERSQLEILRPDYGAARRRRGVFGLRSTTRPNSIGMIAGKLTAIDGRMIEFESLELLDGTPVVDIKRYSPSWDCIFSARSARDQFQSISDISSTEELEHAARIFHGSFTPDIAAGARLAQYVVRRWNVRPKDNELIVTVPPEPAYGVLADAIQGITAATLGNGRLRVRPGEIFEFQFQDRELSATTRDLTPLSLTEIRIEPIERLFVLSEKD